MDRPTLEPAYVLHMQPYRETSALVNLLTRDYGRVALVARGIRRARSHSRTLVQPFTPLLVSWTGRGELGTLTAVERAMSLLPLHGRALLSGLYLNELLMRLTHRFDPHPQLFEDYARSLAALAEVVPEEQAQIEGVLRHFEKRLLDELGYGLLLEHEADSDEPIVEHSAYNYLSQHGPVRTDTVTEHSARPSVTVHGSTLLALATGESLQSRARAEAKRLMRMEIDAHLGAKPLASRSLFRSARGSRAR